MIDLARVMGATKVIAAQRSKKRMEIARQYGADAYIDTSSEDLVARCLEETDGRGPDMLSQPVDRWRFTSRRCRWWRIAAMLICSAA